MAERGSGNVFEMVSMRKRVAEEELTSIKDTKRRVQQFLTSYNKTWPFISASRKGDSYAYCKLCETDLSIRSGGGNDISRHIKSEKQFRV